MHSTQPGYPRSEYGRTNANQDRRPRPAPPAPEVPQLTLADIKRANSFKRVVDTYGLDYVANTVGIAHPRLNRLALAGDPINKELAMCIETELQLPQGFLDSDAPVPPLPGMVAAPQVSPPVAAPVAAPVADIHGTPFDSDLGSAPVAPAPTPPAPVAVAPVPPPVDAAPPIVTAPPGRPRWKSDEALALSDLRRKNLAMLTRPTGFKSALAQVSGLQVSYLSRMASPGVKGSLTPTQASRIEAAVQLPDGWLSSEQSEVPEHVIRALSYARETAKDDRQRTVQIELAQESGPAAEPLASSEVQPPRPAPIPVAASVPTPEVIVTAQAAPEPMPVVPVTVQKQDSVVTVQAAPAQATSPAVPATEFSITQAAALANAYSALLMARVTAGEVGVKQVYALLGNLLIQE